MSELINAREQMRKQAQVFKLYCTDECVNCPLSEMCDWDGNVEYDSPRLTNEALQAYSDFYLKKKEEAERENYHLNYGCYPEEENITREYCLEEGVWKEWED